MNANVMPESYGEWLAKQAFEVQNETSLTPRQIAEQRAELLAALTKIACYDDLSAWKQQRAHNSYSHFDEPGSVQIAHEALAKVTT